MLYTYLLSILTPSLTPFLIVYRINRTHLYYFLNTNRTNVSQSESKGNSFIVPSQGNVSEANLTNLFFESSCKHDNE